MSMPSFPPNGAGMTREEALTMIIASIAMEELALSHILNAEGEKLQWILGPKPCASPGDVLAVNKSVTALLEAVMQNQMLLKSKLEKVLEVCPVPPCPPPCGPERCPESALQLVLRKEGFLWKQGCRLPWRQQACRGEEICWCEQNPSQICLRPGRAYAVRYTLNACAMRPGTEPGALILRQTPCGAFTETPPLYFSMERAGMPQTLQYAAVLYPSGSCGGELSLVLNAQGALCVEQAVMDIAAL